MNRTVAAHQNTTGITFCSASAELEGALRLAKERGFTGPRFVWGSSFTATLALRLAAEHPGDFAGVLAFSPAGGEPMDALARRDRLPASEHRAPGAGASFGRGADSG